MRFVFFTIIVATIGTILATFTLYPQYIELSYFSTDFIDYCIGIEAFEHKRLLGPFKRSQIAAILPWK